MAMKPFFTWDGEGIGDRIVIGIAIAIEGGFALLIFASLLWASS